MREQKTFLASDLADLLKVPRTTINDWLSRYSAFIDFELRGKRKVYFDSSLTVLKEISDLRADGKNAFDIEKTLESRHGVRPEVASVEKLNNNESIDSTTLSSGLVRQSAIDGTLGSVFPELKALTEHFEELNTRRQKGIRRGLALIGLFLFLLLALIGVGGYFAYLHMAALNSDNRNLLGMVSQQLEDNRNLQGNLKVLREESTRQNDELKSSQKQQQQQLKQAIDELRNETVQTKNELSQRQQELLLKIEDTVSKAPVAVEVVLEKVASTEPLEKTENVEKPVEEVKE